MGWVAECPVINQTNGPHGTHAHQLALASLSHQNAGRAIPLRRPAESARFMSALMSAKRSPTENRELDLVSFVTPPLEQQLTASAILLLKSFHTFPRERRLEN